MTVLADLFYFILIGINTLYKINASFSSFHLRFWELFQMFLLLQMSQTNVARLSLTVFVCMCGSTARPP